ncbi:hypothetical protein NPIL_585061 [Nephila pilipes]|uniref:Uncharacterized protein n=1 Tax=Nephila pilipes TaxID=299642 RepID=A0A8X6QKM5_NEPPI|nr:hypothetical protein NPIL_585061 [Nephila pilipes]
MQTQGVGKGEELSTTPGLLFLRPLLFPRSLLGNELENFTPSCLFISYSRLPGEGVAGCHSNPANFEVRKSVVRSAMLSVKSITVILVLIGREMDVFWKSHQLMFERELHLKVLGADNDEAAK